MKHILIFLLSVFVSSVSQILLKKSANTTHDNVIKEYLHPQVLTQGATSITFFVTPIHQPAVS